MPRDPLVHGFIPWAKRRLEDDNDVVILLTGREGSGKSTLAFLLSHAIDSSFDLERVSFTGPMHIKKCRDGPKKRAYWLDEAIEGGFSRDALKRENKDLAKWLVVSRERNQCNIIVFPKKQWVDNYIRDHRAHVWMHVSGRGRAQVYRPKHSEFGKGQPFWQRDFTFRFPKATGPKWDEYIARKRAYVKGHRVFVTTGEPKEAELDLDRVRAMRRLLQEKAPEVMYA